MSQDEFIKLTEKVSLFKVYAEVVAPLVKALTWIKDSGLILRNNEENNEPLAELLKDYKKQERVAALALHEYFKKLEGSGIRKDKYYICEPCATKLNWEFPGLGATYFYIKGLCGWCERKDVATLIPVVEFNRGGIPWD